MTTLRQRIGGLEIPPAVLVGLNALLIVAAEATGDFFNRTGLIHGFALALIVLASIRLLRTYYVFDPEVRRYLRASLAAMAVFAVSHLVELVSFIVLRNYQDTTYACVINLYAISLSLILVGSESVMRSYRGTRGRGTIVAAWALIALLSILTAAMLFSRIDVSLEPGSVIPYLYAFGLAALVAATLARAVRIARMYGSYASFFRRMAVSAALVAAAAYQYVFYGAIRDLGVPEYQVIYLSHFFFYAALSVMFLSFGSSLEPQGVFKDVRDALRAEQAGKALENIGKK